SSSCRLAGLPYSTCPAHNIRNRVADDGGAGRVSGHRNGILWQELGYGSSRLVSAREAPNVRLTFDGAKAILKFGGWQVGAFFVKPVRTKVGVFDDDPDPGTFGASAASHPFRG